MWYYTLLALAMLLPSVNRIWATNHFALKDDGFIRRRLDSPFHLRDPGNLLAFIEQIGHNECAEQAFRKMHKKRSKLDEHIQITAQLLQTILDSSKCARVYVKMTGLSDYLRTTGASMKRLKFPEKMEKEVNEGEPICKDYTQMTGIEDNYGHLRSFEDDVVRTMVIDREENLLKLELGFKDAGSVTDLTQSLAINGLLNNPKSWEFHMLGSYYWRLVGDAKNAMDCARISVYLAPEDYKDIPLLGLGTILVRAELWDDAEIILNDALTYGPEHAENYVALGTLLALKHDFKRAREYFEDAEKLDATMFNNSMRMKQYIDCLEPLDADISRLFSFVKYMLKEIKEVNKLRQEILQYQSKIVHLQLPLASRYTDNDHKSKADLLKRYQYCSTRKSSETQEPVLFCDFYSDLQMQLESKQFDAELLDWQVNRYISHLFEKLPFEYKKQLEILYNTVKAKTPTKVNAFSM